MFFSSETFVQIHVAISLIAIVAGFVVLLGMLTNRLFHRGTAIFLATTFLTSGTGFLFPLHGVTPGIVIGVVSVVTLALASYARYGARLHGKWRATYVVFALASLYLNVFVLIAQAFQKIGFLKNLPPELSGTMFPISQGVVCLAFVAAGWLALKNFSSTERP